MLSFLDADIAKLLTYCTAGGPPASTGPHRQLINILLTTLIRTVLCLNLCGELNPVGAFEDI